jgi:hypothetical protein
MTTCSEIQALINEREKEKAHVELKSFRKIQATDQRSDNLRDIAYEIIALANLNGGKLIFGINDDGGFDGKFEGELDNIKRDIHNLCFDSISPIIECNTEFIECTTGDLFIVYVPKRKSIPHAYVNRKDGKEIKSRIYYIRTSHGKKLVNDAQLEWIFRNQDTPNFSYPFRIGVEFDKQLSVIGSPIPHGNYSIIQFLNQLTEKDRKTITENSEKFYQFFIELCPYFILHSIADYYSQSWYIGISKGFDRVSSGPKITPVPIPTIEVDISEIAPKGNRIIETLSWNFVEILKQIFDKKIHIPSETKISIEYENNSKLAKLLWQNKNFSISIGVGMLSAGAGLHQRSTHFEVLTERNPFEGHTYSMSNFYHFDGAGYLEANFDFPEYDIDQFNKHRHYFDTLQELINDHWNFDKFRQKLPPKELLVMDDKLNEILQHIQNRKI